VTSSERKNIEAKILDGARIAVMRLVETEIKNGSELTLFRDGKVVTIKAKEIYLTSLSDLQQ
jgi:hypothetical protein